MAKLRGGDKGPLGPQSGDLRIVTIDIRHQESGTRGGSAEMALPNPTFGSWCLFSGLLEGFGWCPPSTQVHLEP